MSGQVEKLKRFVFMATVTGAISAPYVLSAVFLVWFGYYVFSATSAGHTEPADCTRPWIARAYIGAFSGKYQCSSASSVSATNCIDASYNHLDFVHWNSATVEITYKTECPK